MDRRNRWQLQLYGIAEDFWGYCSRVRDRPYGDARVYSPGNGVSCRVLRSKRGQNAADRTDSAKLSIAVARQDLSQYSFSMMSPSPQVSVCSGNLVGQLRRGPLRNGRVRRANKHPPHGNVQLSFERDFF